MTKPFYITFGKPETRGMYTIIHALNQYQAKAKAFELYGRDWSMLYHSSEAAGVEKFGLTLREEIGK